MTDKGNVSVLDQLGHSLLQWFHTLNSLYFKAYFSFEWHLESPYTDLLQFKHKCTYVFATNLNNKQGKNSHSKTWLLIPSLHKPPFSKNNPLYGQGHFHIFFRPLTPPRHTHTHTLKTLEHQTHKKLITESYFFKTAISYPFFRNTGWDLVQNDNNLRYHKDHKKNQYNCIETPASKSQIYWLRYQSNRKLLHFYQHAKNQIQQILTSHELKGHAHPKIIEATISFPKFVAPCKKSIYSNCSFLRYIQF